MHLALWGRCNLRTTQLALEVGVLQAALSGAIYPDLEAFLWCCDQQQENFKFLFPIDGSPDKLELHLGRLGTHLAAVLAANVVKGVGKSIMGRLRHRVSDPGTGEEADRGPPGELSGN